MADCAFLSCNACCQRSTDKLSLHPLPLISLPHVSFFCALLFLSHHPSTSSSTSTVCLWMRLYWSWKCVTVTNFDSSPCRLALSWEERVMRPIHGAEDHASKAKPSFMHECPTSSQSNYTVEDSNSGWLKRTGAVCWHTAHQAIGADNWCFSLHFSLYYQYKNGQIRHFPFFVFI